MPTITHKHARTNPGTANCRAGVVFCSFEPSQRIDALFSEAVRGCDIPQPIVSCIEQVMTVPHIRAVHRCLYAWFGLGKSESLRDRSKWPWLEIYCAHTQTHTHTNELHLLFARCICIICIIHECVYGMFGWQHYSRVA